MIVRPKPTLWDVLFTLKGSIARAIAIRLASITLFAAAVTWIGLVRPDLFHAFNAAPFTLIGLSLSIFMSFRNNACYDRWWEARKQWGAVVAETRSLIRESDHLAALPERQKLLRALIGFAHALSASLRDRDPATALEPWIEPGTADVPNLPALALTEAGRALDTLADRGALSEWRYLALATRLANLGAAQAACERIKTTPLPFAYTLLLHRTAYLFCCLLPFGLAAPLGWATPLITAIVSYTFFGLDALGDELEQPFGRDVNDLPLDALVRLIERDLRHGLGETDLPAPLEPIDYLLS